MGCTILNSWWVETGAGQCYCDGQIRFVIRVERYRMSYQKMYNINYTVCVNTWKQLFVQWCVSECTCGSCQIIHKYNVSYLCSAHCRKLNSVWLHHNCNLYRTSFCCCNIVANSSIAFSSVYTHCLPIVTY